ncbi:MAG: hypothetical protein KA198_08660 [Chitinophagaceae bacterium]|nr:hypothetical protein [Chitinophagaceae bacterium]
MSFLLVFSCKDLFAQTNKIYQGLILDEVMVKAVQGGFDVESFIDKIKDDTTFYKAFKTLRLLSYNMYNDIEIVNKKDEVVASYTGISKQVVNNHCRTMEVKQEKVTGDYYTSKKNFRYYTAKLYAHLFFTQGKICNENNIVASTKTNQHGTEKYEEQLRNLIFNPGQPIRGIPGIGDNVEIFEQPYVDRYQFKLSKVDYNNEPCYVFKAIPKPEFVDDVVINELKTWFRASDYAIVARDYSLSYKTWIYDFDVVMSVKLKNVKSFLVPYEIHYKGNWHAVTKPRENATFTAIFTDFE